LEVNLNVLSLFDGMSCGQIALERTNIGVDNYFASEIDKYAIQITQKNYPKTIQLGDVTKWKSWNLPKIDLLIGGSPCQGFSIAGKGINFNDSRSKLFFEYVKILKYLKNKNTELKFLLENVRMKKEWQEIISKYLKTEPILINSSLVSAQNRQRLYWTNWKFEQPKDKHIYLKDILENIQDIDVDILRDKSKTIRVGGRKSPPNSKQEWDNIYKNGLVFVGGIGDKDWAKDGKELSRNFPQGSRIYSDNGKSPSLAAHSGGNLEPKIAVDDITYRKLTVIECERLQTVPDNYTEGVSNSQRYKMLGNGWTIDVIAHILSYM
jgi:DNA-cytosine methyltransferase